MWMADYYTVDVSIILKSAQEKNIPISFTLFHVNVKFADAQTLAL